MEDEDDDGICCYEPKTCEGSMGIGEEVTYSDIGGLSRPVPMERPTIPGSATSDLVSPSRSPRIWCSLCVNFLGYMEDGYYCKCVEPTLTRVDGREKYRVRTTPGWNQCGVTGLRWKSCCEAELEYRIEDWDQFSEFLKKERLTPCGPLMNIRLISGDITSLCLPHFLCPDRHYDVKVLRSGDSGVSLEECWLSPFHAIPLRTTFSTQGVVISSEVPVNVHYDVLIYRTSAAHLTLRVYLVPWDLNMKKSVEKREKDSVEILWEGEEFPLPLGEDYTLRTSCPSHITPQSPTSSSLSEITSRGSSYTLRSRFPQ